MLRLVIGTPRRQERALASTTNDVAPDDDSTNDVESTASETVELSNLIHITDEDLLEPWPEFMKRATQIVNTQIDKHNIEEWTTTYFRRKWRWAARIAKQPTNRWSQLAAYWDPEIHDARRATRAQSRPRKRWDDLINDFLHTLDSEDGQPLRWMNMACNTTQWTKLEAQFIQYALNDNTKTPTVTNNTTDNTNTTA